MTDVTYISGGYIIVKAAPRPDWLGDGLLPETVVSASPCLCTTIPDVWAIGWANITDERRREEASQFGLSGERLDALVNWATNQEKASHLLWPNVLVSLATARELLERFMPDRQDLHLLGIALAEQLMSTFVASLAPDCPSGACPRIGLPGVCGALQRREALADGGEVLGFEILGMADAPPFHSWLCNGLHELTAKELGIRPNARGFIDGQADAAKVAEFCNRPDTPGEPASWGAWRIVEYAG